ncbi:MULTISPECIES: helix-turn-helix domain-containing protein [Clostridium]|uniref:Helix-turn-helix transcriptional regulator n=1 Tax=Clostridium frigoriphilum TaxID=443253 RepID=A0ABU7UJ99_9CLOT|nr:helix-turn-helix transcriptional regulator [Clostridium sp. DSM 17811]MBU3098408.1 helix-turn-helix domain-containing protein [Clostridium sp. DSM 17811]
MIFGNRLRALREDSDLTSNEFAEIMHITSRALNYYENNMREPSFPLLINIADYFKVSIDFLLGRTDTQTPYPKKQK